MPETDFNLTMVVDELNKKLSELTPTELIDVSAKIGTYYEDTITQNPDGTWSKIRTYEEVSSLTAEQKQLQAFNKKAEQINNYATLCVPYDKKIEFLNNQINIKKLQIVELFNTAVSSNCDLKPFVENSNTLLINCVSCGIGSTVYSDTIFAKRYKNMEYLEEENVYQLSEEQLDYDTYGKGFADVAYSNAGEENGGQEIGHFISITDISSPCVAIANSISDIATEIDNLRKERDSNIASVNTIKTSKSSAEFSLWSLSNFTFSEFAANALKTTISNLTNIQEEIALDKLLVYFDAGRGYSIKTKTNSQTGVTLVTKIDNLGSDGSLVSVGDQGPTYDSLDGPSIWFNQYGITGKYFDLPKSYVLNSGEGIDECGTSDLFGDASFSMEAWIKITNTSYLSSDIITGGASIVGVASTAGIGLQVYEPEADKAVINFGSRGSGSLDSTSEIQVDYWYHVVGVREQNKGSKLYINGVLESSTNTVGIGTTSLYITTPKTGSVMRVGFCNNAYINQYFPGKISVIRLYAKALSESDITKNFNASKSRYTLFTS
jgi:hypothetical protein